MRFTIRQINAHNIPDSCIIQKPVTLQNYSTKPASAELPKEIEKNTPLNEHKNKSQFQEYIFHITVYAKYEHKFHLIL